MAGIWDGSIVKYPENKVKAVGRTENVLDFEMIILQPGLGAVLRHKEVEIGAPEDV